MMEAKEQVINLMEPRKQLHAYHQELTAAFERILTSGNYVLGEECERLEQEVAEYLGVQEAITLANGTDALILALEAGGVGPGDEVITTPFSFFATAEAILRIGAIPIFVDVDPTTYNLDVTQIEERITSRTRAILPVHLFGLPAAMEPIMSIAKQYELMVIEDACQAFGACYAGKKVGGLGDAGCFSFFPTKNLGTIGDGGMVVTNSKELAERIRLLRNHGSARKYFHTAVGYNSRLDEIHAAILRILLPQVDQWNQQRVQLAQRYYEQLRSCEKITIQKPIAGHIYHLFSIEVEQRERLQAYLQKYHISSGTYYPYPLHTLPALAGIGRSGETFPVAERLAKELLALPLHPHLSITEQDHVISTIQQYYQEQEG